MCSSIVTGMSSGKSDGSHSGPYGAAVITSLGWFSGNNDPSRKFMGISVVMRGGGAVGSAVPDKVNGKSTGHVADDSRALHLSMARRVIHHCVMLGAAVVPDGDAVGRPAPADLVFGDMGLA